MIVRDRFGIKFYMIHIEKMQVLSLHERRCRCQSGNALKPPSGISLVAASAVCDGMDVPKRHVGRYDAAWTGWELGSDRASRQRRDRRPRGREQGTEGRAQWARRRQRRSDSGARPRKGVLRRALVQTARPTQAKRRRRGAGAATDERPREGNGQRFPVVGIGASAGGLGALRRFLGATPDRTRRRFGHRAASGVDQQSLTPELLAKHTRMHAGQVDGVLDGFLGEVVELRRLRAEDLLVGDNGVGIDWNQCSRRHRTSHDAIPRGLIGASIKIESGKGKDTTVICALQEKSNMGAGNRQAKTGQRKVRIFLVDDHAIVRCGLAGTISRDPDFEICGEADGVASALPCLRNGSVDLVIVDISLKDGNGIELVEQLCSRNRRPRVLVYSMHDDALFAERALHAGAMGYINKTSSAETLLAAIRQVMRGEIAVSPEIAKRVMQQAVGGNGRDSKGPLDDLTPRELEVFQLIGEGRTTGEVANQLCLSRKTVETHRGKVKRKLGLKNSAELSRCAMQWAILRKPPND